ncbi:MAG: hypothetical protein OXU96_09230 [Gammaproteobacteria bacterium]|nr:hypothetical protein [Gammaproteobacteria bacterium]
MKMNPDDLNAATPTALSPDALRRPLSRAEKDALGGGWSAEDLVAALSEFFAQSTQNPEAVQSAGQKAMLDLAACIRIQEALESHLLDMENGAIPGFVRQAERAVEYFDRQLM